MKVKNISEDMKEFKPVSINITFESKEELGAFYALFNYSQITDRLDEYDISARSIRDSLGDHKDTCYKEMWDYINSHWSK